MALRRTSIFDWLGIAQLSVLITAVVFNCSQVPLGKTAFAAQEQSNCCKMEFENIPLSVSGGTCTEKGTDFVCVGNADIDKPNCVDKNVPGFTKCRLINGTSIWVSAQCIALTPPDNAKWCYTSNSTKNKHKFTKSCVFTYDYRDPNPTKWWCNCDCRHTLSAEVDGTQNVDICVNGSGAAACP